MAAWVANLCRRICMGGMAISWCNSSHGVDEDVITAFSDQRMNESRKHGSWHVNDPICLDLNVVKAKSWSEMRRERVMITGGSRVEYSRKHMQIPHHSSLGKSTSNRHVDSSEFLYGYTIGLRG
jgi:hypothetical protein